MNEIMIPIRLLELWPDAIHVRRAGRCHCGAASLYSFHLARFDGQPKASGMGETCGYWCATCNFSNAGSRPREV